MQTITVNFDGKQYMMELYSSVIGDKKVYTVLVSDPQLIKITGRVISYLSDKGTPTPSSVQFSSEKTPFKGRLKAAIARSIEETLNRGKNAGK